jgi:ElaB/YqjD/DUF883 family membrane-anchored ribosome-binding protein
MNNRELQKKLSSLAALKASGEPNALWVTETRALLLEKISASTPEPVTSAQEVIKLPRVGFFPKFMFAMRPVMVIVMLCGFGAFGYFGSIGAVASALPGDMLYGIKNITEQAQLTFATSDDARALLHAEFASRRASEVAALAEAGSGASEQNMNEAVTNLADEMKNVSTTMQAVKSDYGSGAVTIAKAVDRQAAEVRAILGKTKGMLAPASQQQIQSVEDLADDISLQAVAVLVAAPSGAKTDDVKNRVQENIDAAQKKLEIASPEGASETKIVKQAKAALDAAQNDVNSQNYAEALAKVQEAASLTADNSNETIGLPSVNANSNLPAADAGANGNDNANLPAAEAGANGNDNANLPAAEAGANDNANSNTNTPNKIRAIDQ